MKRLVSPFFERYLIFFTITAIIGSLILLNPVKVYPHSLKDNPIVRENRKHGTTRWQSKELAKQSKTSVDTEQVTRASVWTDTTIRGYANTTSINHGDVINFYVGTTHPSYSIQIYRMGWYGGTGSTLVTTISNLSGQNQPIPVADPTTQLLELNWNVSYTLQTDTTWTTGMYLAKLIANSIYWQIRFEPSTTGVANRVMTCYKDATLDPYNQPGNPNYNPALTTVKWRDNPVNQPENALLGVMFVSQLNYPNSVPWVVSNADSWVYSGTGLNNGDSIPSLVGYEF